MKILDGLFILTGVIFLPFIPADAASNYRSSGDIIYQSRVGASSQSAREDKALLKDLTRYDPYGEPVYSQPQRSYYSGW